MLLGMEVDFDFSQLHRRSRKKNSGIDGIRTGASQIIVDTATKEVGECVLPKQYLGISSKSLFRILRCNCQNCTPLVWIISLLDSYPLVKLKLFHFNLLIKIYETTFSTSPWIQLSGCVDSERVAFNREEALALFLYRALHLIITCTK